jgi:hypothetical protein
LGKRSLGEREPEIKGRLGRWEPESVETITVEPVEMITLIEDTAKGAEKRKGSEEKGFGLENRGRREATIAATRYGGGHRDEGIIPLMPQEGEQGGGDGM